jgi:hypothetical protein
LVEAIDSEDMQIIYGEFIKTAGSLREKILKLLMVKPEEGDDYIKASTTLPSFANDLANQITQIKIKMDYKVEIRSDNQPNVEKIITSANVNIIPTIYTQEEFD